MQKNANKLLNLVTRYLLILITTLIGMNIFYSLFTPLTVYPTYWLLSLFFNSTLISNTIFISSVQIEIVDSCVAGSAYLLLLLLNLATPNIKFVKRLALLTLSFLSLLMVNILRIFLLSILLIIKEPFFDITHKIFWYGLSTVFVAVIWFFLIKIFKIKEIPFYSDIVALYKLSKNSSVKHSKQHKTKRKH